MDAPALLALVLACAPLVHPRTAQALVHVESSNNPWAIGVVGGRLLHQPRNRAEALATARHLAATGWSFSVGLAQIHIGNLRRLGLTLDDALDPCRNLQAMQSLLTDCQARATRTADPSTSDATALRRALSCYYSGNFSTGFAHGYVHRVVLAVSVAPSRPAPAALDHLAPALAGLSIPQPRE